ncbi:MAG: tail fiber domain-containing protein [Emticicia sp.]|uniref:tail fiber domain-containing protein n=1 Tax=Emticicia sp. TaxID=1930953 RepID=UPI003BA3F12B
MKRKIILRKYLYLLCLTLFSIGAYSQANKNVTVPPKSSEPLLKNTIDKGIYRDVQKILNEKSVMDQVIADDLIVQGSGCFGFDCVNNESFGFDTNRLKENNTRIGFDDTSASAGFPANDWQIEANESASGGKNSFSILDVTGAKTPFRIEAGARTSALYVSSSGKIGVGTSTPVLDVNINTGNTPAVRFEQDASGGFSAQTWDMAGNEANFFIRDVTGGSRLPFRIRPGAPTSSIDISAAGNVGIGTASPSVKLHVAGDGFFSGSIYATNAILPGASSPSDRNLKKDIQNLTGATSIIKQLYPKSFLYDTVKYPTAGLPENLQFGLIAQELETVVPNLVTNNTHPTGLTFKSVNYTGLIPILIKAMQEQQTEIESLKRKIGEYESLNSRLSQLEAMLNNEEKLKTTDKK